MDADVVRAVNELTSRWARALPAENTVVAGLGVWPLLALLASGADEPGRTELAAAAGVDPSGGATAAIRLIEAIEGSADLHAALGVWVDEQLKLAETFDSVVPAPLVGMLTGNPAVDRQKLDAWAADHTDDLIREMPVDLNGGIELLLASAILLRTKWVRPFEEHTRRVPDGPWAGSWRWLERSTADLDSIRRYEHPSAAWLTVVTVAGDADVDVLLGIGQPQTDQADVLAGLLDAAAGLDDGLDGAALIQQGEVGAEVAPGVRIGETTAPRPQLQVSLPAFSIDVEHDLMESRELFGLTTVSSDPGAHGHFSALSPTPLRIDQAKQRVLARFFASGFEAAAVTAMAMTRAAMVTSKQRRLEVAFDRPFAFVAVLRDSRLPIVAGRVEVPTEPGA
ncbi:serine protease inhibitor [Kribbella aluminosa]|uniref:Serine protease inhibitor n=1 Tax=Kribbella aluminosa TaxID=416017 RepID=A0ABS4UV70_9ACTN|nr:serpin family protein [Kribbella aluminosa]MBP2355516.1 serine protease inhibitor [Kribbella aluminosa]